MREENHNGVELDDEDLKRELKVFTLFLLSPNTTSHHRRSQKRIKGIPKSLLVKREMHVRRKISKGN